MIAQIRDLLVEVVGETCLQVDLELNLHRKVSVCFGVVDIIILHEVTNDEVNIAREDASAGNCYMR